MYAEGPDELTQDDQHLDIIEKLQLDEANRVYRTHVSEDEYLQDAFAATDMDWVRRAPRDKPLPAGATAAVVGGATATRQSGFQPRSSNTGRVQRSLNSSCTLTTAWRSWCRWCFVHRRHDYRRTLDRQC